jgi:hypothetical protein
MILLSPTTISLAPSRICKRRLNGNRVQAQGFTLVVNAHGGLLEAPLRLAAKQRIALVNPSSGKLAECRVIRSDGQRDAYYTIASPSACSHMERSLA